MGLIICLVILSNIWNKTYGEPLIGRMDWRMAQTLDVFLGRIFPLDERFLSLRFSALRHFVTAIVSVLIMWKTDSMWVDRIILSINFFYVALKIWVQSNRKRIYKSEEGEHNKLLLPSLKASLVVTLYSVFTYLVVFVASIFL